MESSEINISVRHLLQSEIRVVPNLKAVLASLECGEESSRATDEGLADFASEIVHFLYSLIIELLRIARGILETIKFVCGCFLW